VQPSPEAPSALPAAQTAAAGSVAVAATPPAVAPTRPAPIRFRTAEELRKLTNEDVFTPPYVPTAEQLAALRENDPPEPAPAPRTAATAAGGADQDDEDDRKPRVLSDEKRRLLQDD